MKREKENNDIESINRNTPERIACSNDIDISYIVTQNEIDRIFQLLNTKRDKLNNTLQRLNDGKNHNV